MARLSFRGTLVVVTGASSGLGREIARRLAVAEGADLVLVARRAERLEALRSEIAGACPSSVTCVAADLGTADGVAKAAAAADAAGTVFGLVNCAGTTHWGRTLDAPASLVEGVFGVDLLAGVRLTLHFLAGFLERGSGALLTVTSLAAVMPMPFQNVYSAAKHGMQAFVEGLAREYRGRGVTFTTFLPGGLATEWLTATGLDRVAGFDSPFNMDPARAARIAVDRWKAGAGRVVPGAINKAIAGVVRVAPRRLVSWAAAKLYDPQARRMPKTGV